MNQGSLFGESTDAVYELKVEDIRDLYGGNELGRFSDETEEEFQDMVWDDPRKGEEYEIPGLGTFECLANWGVSSDGRRTGFVLKHHESGLVVMFDGIYSSWDSTEFTIDEAEPREVTTVKWVAK